MNIEQLKLKRLITELDTYQGFNTSLITLSLPPSTSLILEKKKLDLELNTCSEIKSRL